MSETTTTRARSRKVTAITDAKGATATGRTSTGDNDGGHNLTNKGKRPESAAKPTPTPAAKAKTTLGPSGYRQKHGTTDAAILAAVRAHAKSMTEADPKSGWDVITEAFTDSELLEVIGWSYTPAAAIKKAGVVVKTRAEAETA